MNHKDFCPCSSGVSYSSCCQPLVDGRKDAVTAQALMRSRYTAYFLKDEKYLLRTWHPSTRPITIGFDSISGWCGLNIVRTEAGGEDDIDGVVEFIARATSHKKILTLHEVSRFVKQSGQWFYLDGDLEGSEGAIVEKVGRNLPCPCGSGKKFKRCCGV